MPQYRASINYCKLSEQQANQIAQGTGLVIDDISLLMIQIDEAAEEFIHNHYREAFSPPSKQAKTFKSIADRADKLLKAMGAPDGDASIIPIEVSSPLFKGDFQALEAAARDIAKLRDSARQSAEFFDAKKQSSPDRHKKSEAFTDFICSLRNIYVCRFGKLPGATLNKKKGGPFIRFLTGVLDAVRMNLSDEARCAAPDLIGWLKLDEEGWRYVVRHLPPLDEGEWQNQD